MNPTQIGGFIRQILMAFGASATVAGIFTSEAGIAVIGAVLAVGTAVMQWRTQTNTAIIDSAAKLPEVKEVIVSSPKVAMATHETNVRAARK